MRVLLLPRIDAGVSRSLISERWNLSVLEAKALSSTSHVRQTYASNGERIAPDVMEALVDDLREAAVRYGYPVVPSGDSQLRAWDAEATTVVWRHLSALCPAEGARTDTWSFLTIVATPDLVLWRYPSGSAASCPPGLQSRFLGGRRNLLKRFWLRARALVAYGADFSLLLTVREDDLQQVFERPSLGAVPHLAGLVLSSLASSPEGFSVRDVLKRLNREMALTALHVLDPDALQSLINEKIDASKRAVVASSSRLR